MAWRPRYAADLPVGRAWRDQWVGAGLHPIGL